MQLSKVAYLNIIGLVRLVGLVGLVERLDRLKVAYLDIIRRHSARLQRLAKVFLHQLQLPSFEVQLMNLEEDKGGTWRMREILKDNP